MSARFQVTYGDVQLKDPLLLMLPVLEVELIGKATIQGFTVPVCSAGPRLSLLAVPYHIIFLPADFSGGSFSLSGDSFSGFTSGSLLERK